MGTKETGLTVRETTMLTAYDTVRIYLRTQATNAQLKPYVDMAIAGAESILGKSIIEYGEEAPKEVAQATLMLLGLIWETKAVDKIDGLLAPYIDHRATA